MEQHIQLTIKASQRAVSNALVDRTVSAVHFLGFEADFDLRAESAHR